MRHLRKLVWFIASRLFIVLLLLGILTVTFYYAMNATNIYVIVKDGMARRAQVIMMDEPASSLDAYFSASWLERDELLRAALDGNGPYQNVQVTGFDHRITLQSVWCWPWDSIATATVIERIPAIDGRSVSGTVPAWQAARYTMVLSNESGNWRIRNIEVVEYLNNE
ncbi:MAG: hypothetical protein IJS53_00275 [Clostridia bacterium]|nr:hypothetical protein [Clostridia bacterium]